MNFTEFEKNVQVMKEKLLEEGISPEDVEIEYTRFDGYNALWAMYERERIVHYFKW